MFKAVLFACLCVAVLADNRRNQQMPRQPQGQNSLIRLQNNLNRPQNSPNQPRNRVIRQMPQMPGMNPGDFPQMMSDGIQKGIGAMGNMMDPGKWMQAGSQMIPKSNDSH